MGATLIERSTDLRGVVGHLTELRDGMGVLSITIGIEPGAVSGGTPAVKIALDNDLRRLSRDRAVGRTIERRLAGATTRLSALLDTTLAGRGRALYVALESGASSDVVLQDALPTGARVGPVAHVLPLLAALDEGEPAGFVRASRDAISVSECELGVVRHVERIELEPWVGDWWPEMKAAARANPLRGLHTVSHRDRYARRVAAAYRHTLGSAARAIGSLADERGWTKAVVTGDPRRTDALDNALRKAGLRTTVVGATLEGVRGEIALERLEAALETLAAEQTLELAREAHTEATAGGKGACGLAHVLAALAEGRVARVLIDPRRSFPGGVGPGERLSAVAGPASVDLTDWIVAHALSTGAAVTPLGGGAAEVMEGHDGIGALLRW